MSRNEIRKELLKVVAMMDRQSRSMSTKVSTIRQTRERYEALLQQLATAA